MYSIENLITAFGSKISLDNGRTYMSAEEAMPEILGRGIWEVVVSMMDDETRENVHMALAPCSELEFLTRYLEVAPYDLTIG